MPLKAYKFRIYPNKTQQKKLTQFFGAKRFVWNTCLAWRSSIYKDDGESVSGVDFSRELTWLKKTEGYEWLKDVPSTILTQGILDQDKAFKKFFKDPKTGYPKFKSKHQKQSIRFQMDQRRVMNNYRAGEFLKVTGLGEIKVRWSRIPNGIPKMVTISKDQAGRYFVSMGVEADIKQLPTSKKAVGIDLGTLQAMITSDGWIVDNPRHLQQRKDQLKKLQQRLARQKKDSNRRAKTKHRIAKLHSKIADCRREYIHQVTSRIINENQVIVIEDLNVKGMTASSKGDRENPGKMVKQKSGLNRNVLDVSFGEIARQLEYKAQWYGRDLIKVDRWFPSSKLCSCCGHKVDEMQLDIREWTCPKCGSVHDRDINAAINILNEGLSPSFKHPQEGKSKDLSGEVLDAGGEGACPVSVSPRSLDQSSSCQERE